MLTNQSWQQWGVPVTHHWSEDSARTTFPKLRPRTQPVTPAQVAEVTPVGAAILKSPPVQFTSLDTIKSKSFKVNLPRQEDTQWIISHCIIYTLLWLSLFQSQIHIIASYGWRFYPLTYHFNPLDFNPVKVPVNAQSSGNTTNQPLLPPTPTLLYSYLLFYIYIRCSKRVKIEYFLYVSLIP